MPLQDYNGFSGAQRERSQRWLNKEWKEGRLPRPSECAACGKADGKIQAHAEDYSAPFRAGVTDQFHLCRTCHFKVHYRARNEKNWRDYRAKIEAANPERRKVLLEIELSQDAAARRLANGISGS